MQSFFSSIKSQGFIFSDSVDQLLCESCDRFLADRFVEGICPRCKYEEARGDQCDGCGHLVNATDLISPRCKVCSSRPIVKKSNQFFLDLPKASKQNVNNVYLHNQIRYFLNFYVTYYSYFFCIPFYS